MLFSQRNSRNQKLKNYESRGVIRKIGFIFKSTWILLLLENENKMKKSFKFYDQMIWFYWGGGGVKWRRHLIFGKKKRNVKRFHNSRNLLIHLFAYWISKSKQWNQYLHTFFEQVLKTTHWSLGDGSSPSSPSSLSVHIRLSKCKTNEKTNIQYQQNPWAYLSEDKKRTACD